MLTKEQLEDAARFMGISIEEDGVDINGLPWYWSPELDRHWMPEFDWNDFGPLWVKLERWLLDTTAPGDIYLAWDFECAEFLQAMSEGTDQEIMQSGLMLAAAIGKTMAEPKSKCQHCGKPIASAKSAFCSLECADADNEYNNADL